MIEGLKLRVTSSELKGHCLKRAGYHRDRADGKRRELPGLKEAMERIKASTGATSPASVATMSKGYHLNTEDPVADLERDIAGHANKALVFEFFAEHLFDEDYTLAEDDLVRLELLRR